MILSNGRVATATMALTICAAAGAQAEMTPQGAWQAISDYYTSVGYTLTTGSRTTEGSTLVLGDIRLQSGQDEAVIACAIEEARLGDMGDGRVELTLSDRIPCTLSYQPQQGESAEVEFDLSQSGGRVIISGSPADTQYALTAPAAAISSQGTIDDDTGSMDYALTATLSDITSTTSYRTGDMIEMTSDLSVGRTVVDLSSDSGGADAAQRGTTTFHGEFADIAGTTEGTLPPDFYGSEPSAAIGDGMDVSGNFTVGASEARMNFEAGEMARLSEINVERGTLDFAVSKDGLRYNSGATNTRARVEQPNLPFPVEFSARQTETVLEMPLEAAEATQPYAMKLNLAGVEMSEGIWSLFDAGGRLPRDPMDLLVDLSGTAKLDASLYDPEDAVDLEAGQAIKIETLDLNALALSAVGAELTGKGAFDIDSTVTPPTADGSVDLTISGSDRLIDALIVAGLLPKDQAMGARMMLGMFTVPGQREDELISKIEIRKDGSISANGQRIR